MDYWKSASSDGIENGMDANPKLNIRQFIVFQNESITNESAYSIFIEYYTKVKNSK